MNSINSNCITLPQWLDSCLFKELKAYYSRSNADMVVLNWNSEEILSYLGTYFPRSYAESYQIFLSYFAKYKREYECRTSITLFDFGCGTGGELVGFLLALSEILPNIKHIEVHALDGNQNELRFLETILEKVRTVTNLTIRSRVIPIIIDDLYDMRVVTDNITTKFDFIISFKTICEFVTKKQFEERNPYEHILNIFLPKLTNGGVICIADITTFNDISKEWLTSMLDRASSACNVTVLERNQGYNEEFFVSHSSKKNDKSKIAWRLYKSNNLNYEEGLDD